MNGTLCCVLILAAGLAGARGWAQETAPAAVGETGKIVYSAGQAAPAAQPNSVDVFPKQPVTNGERAAVTILADDLDLHLTPADAGEEAHALLTLRNVSAAPLKRIPIQITSTLRWLSAATAEERPHPLVFTQSPIATDADHTGYAQEAVLVPEHPLGPGATMMVSVFFAGQIPASTARLELLGTPAERAAATDWDAIVPTSDERSTALRGFGEVLWYPVCAPTALLGEGNQMLQVAGQERFRNVSATMRLRLAVLYAGDPPDAAIFNGHLQPLLRTPDDRNQVIDETHGVATTDFAMAPIGFQMPSLFLTAQHPVQPGSPLLSAITPVPEAAEPYGAAVERLQPFFAGWMAPAPLSPLLLLDHTGVPFEEGGFIAAHLSPSARPEAIAPEIVRALAHAWFSDPGVAGLWLDQGVPEFMSLLWTEATSGRAAALAQMQQHTLALALSEPDLLSHGEAAGSALSTLSGRAEDGASLDVLLRFKSAAVLWQLRDLLGDKTMREAMSAFRRSLTLNAGFGGNPMAFERSLEKTSGVDLAWFFNDWVYHDRSLPDLTIVQAIPRVIVGKGGRGGGFLVAVDVRNDGFAAAEVPVTARAGSVSASARLRVPGRSTASTRIVFEGMPETVQVNDGSVPELRTSTHTVRMTNNEMK